jgi:uncharacterized protein YjbI with pentapeptide repeats
LEGANLEGADFSRANLNGANLSSVRINQATQLEKKWLLVWETLNQASQGSLVEYQAHA